jgi:hypothetical protein
VAQRRRHISAFRLDWGPIRRTQVDSYRLTKLDANPDANTNAGRCSSLPLHAMNSDSVHACAHQCYKPYRFQDRRIRPLCHHPPIGETPTNIGASACRTPRRATGLMPTLMPAPVQLLARQCNVESLTPKYACTPVEKTATTLGPLRCEPRIRAALLMPEVMPAPCKSRHRMSWICFRSSTRSNRPARSGPRGRACQGPATCTRVKRRSGIPA